MLQTAPVLKVAGLASSSEQWLGIIWWGDAGDGDRGCLCNTPASWAPGLHKLAFGLLAGGRHQTVLHNVACPAVPVRSDQV